MVSRHSACFFKLSQKTNDRHMTLYLQRAQWQQTTQSVNKEADVYLVSQFDVVTPNTIRGLYSYIVTRELYLCYAHFFLPVN